MTRTPATLLHKLRCDPDEESWSRFVGLYAPLLYRWLCVHFGLPDQHAQDLSQEVLLVVLQKMPEFHYDPSGSFRAWLFAIVRNKVREFKRNRAASEWLMDPAVLQQKIEQMTDPGSNFGRQLQEEYRSELLIW